MDKTISKTYANQVFYTKKQAMQVQITTNGIFVEVAPALPESDRYNWEAKAGVKFSISEICNLVHAMESHRVRGEEGYISSSQTVCGANYKNMQFIHINRKDQQVRTGLNLYNNMLSFVIVNDKAGVRVNFTILPSEKIRLEKFLNAVVNIAFTRGL